MPEVVFYSEEVAPPVKQFLKEHGGKVETEVYTCAVSLPVVLHKVTFGYKNSLSVGGDATPLYRYTLIDGAGMLVQFLRGYGAVPGHPNQYWTTLHVEREDDEKNTMECTETT